MTILVPIVNAPSLYVDNLVVSQSNLTAYGISSGAARDSTNQNDIVLSNNVIVSISTNGINGLDTGVVTANTVYALYLTGSSTDYNPTGGILSLNQSFPGLPKGYDMFRRIGWGITNGATQTARLWQMGTGKERTYYYDAPFSVLSGGSATTFTAVSVASAVPISNPSTNSEGYFILTYTSASSANTVDFGITSAMEAPIVSYSNGAAATVKAPIWIPVKITGSPAAPNISYKTTSGSDSVSLICAGFRDYL